MNERSIEEYTRLYARNYCQGNIEEASGHAIVKEVSKEKDMEERSKEHEV